MRPPSEVDMSAANKVLHTAELLEQILIGVTDMKTLLLAQRVDKFWSEVIPATKTLQKKLFFRPATFDELFSLCMIVPDPRLDCSGENSADEELDRFVNTSGRSNYSAPSNKYALLNPLICYDQLSINIPAASTVAPKGTMSPSWMRMLVTQPPEPTVLATSPLTHRWRAQETIQGGTTQQIEVALEAQRQRHPNPSLPWTLRLDGRQASSVTLYDALQREKDAWPDEVQYDDSESDESDWEYEDPDRWDHYDYAEFEDQVDDADCLQLPRWDSREGYYYTD